MARCLLFHDWGKGWKDPVLREMHNGGTLKFQSRRCLRCNRVEERIV